MNARVERDWRRDVNEVDIVEAAEALGIEHKRKSYIFPHPGCDGVHTSGGYSVFVGTKSRRLHCRRCSGPKSRFDVCDLIAVTLGLDPHALRADDWARIQDEAARRGWCLPEGRKRSQVEYEAWEAERAAAAAQRARAAHAAESVRRNGAIDVHRAWNALSDARVGHELVAKWMRVVRQCPAELVEHLPHDSIAGIPDEPPMRPAGVSEGDWGEALRLMRAGYFVDRRVLIALRDAEGRPVGASRRWHRATAPTDGLAKALGLGERLCREGSPVSWAGGCAIFGDLPMALARARKGEPLFILEGGPDWLIASAATRMAGRGAALAVPGVSTMTRLARLIRDDLWTGPLTRKPDILIIPDEGKAAANAAWESVEVLQSAARVEIRKPAGSDFNEMARGMAARGVVEFMGVG